MKTYLSRSEAVNKYNVSIAKLRGWEKKGVLHRVDTYQTNYESSGAGAPVQWVYDESELEALAKTSPSKSSIPQRLEAKIFGLLGKRVNVIDIAAKTRLPVSEVQRLRDIYVREVEGLFVPGDTMNELRSAGFILENAHDVPRIMRRQHDKIRELVHLLDQAAKKGLNMPRKTSSGAFTALDSKDDHGSSK